MPHTVTRLDFDRLLTYIYLGPSMCPKSQDLLVSEDFLISVMKLSAYWDIDDGMTYTKEEFTRRGNQLHPALQFELGRCFRIDAWIEPGFRRLMDINILDLDSIQINQIGLQGYSHLTRTKAKIRALRAQIAFHVPPIVNSGDCDTPATCMYSWKREWEERVRQLIHHPENPISCLTLLAQLRNTHIAGLCDGCQDLTVTWIWGKGLLTQEEDLVDEAVEALMTLQMDEPVRAALRESVAGMIMV
ncbi:hypothetical protein C8R44DRAFT_790512 [Mycena epipterygia]|nr:hypothetical protein C8R44DRAFT_790512 [Mycena epipterygia]